ncbi:MAG: hypothetical protein IJW47_02050 [Clostridia bacterium]|nr:hypothetical protein [Clostridia bacterium]
MSEENKGTNQQPDAVVSETAVTAQPDVVSVAQEQATTEQKSVIDSVDGGQVKSDIKPEKVGLMSKIKGFFVMLWAKIVLGAVLVKNKVKALFTSKKTAQQDQSANQTLSTGEVQAEETLDATQNAPEKIVNEKTPEELESIKKKKEERKERAETAVKNTFAFMKDKIFTQSVFNIILLVISIAVVVLGAVEIGIMGYGVANKFDVILSIFKSKDAMGIIAIILVATVILTLLVQAILSLIAIVSKKKSFNLTLLSTMIGFYIAVLFCKKEIDDQIFQTLGFEFKLLNAITIVSLVYSFLQLLNGNFKDRILAVVCGMLCGTVAVLMFSFGVINFFEYNIGESAVSLKDIKLNEYIVGIITLFKDGEVSGVSETTKQFITACAQETSDASKAVIMMSALLLNFIVLFVAKVFPYMALSIIGYVVIVLSSSRGRQVYTIRYIKRIGVSLLTLAILMGICVAALYFLKLPNIAIEINVYYSVYSILGPIALMIMANLPMWRMEKVNIKRLVKLS